MLNLDSWVKYILKETQPSYYMDVSLEEEGNIYYLHSKWLRGILEYLTERTLV